MKKMIKNEKLQDVLYHELLKNKKIYKESVEFTVDEVDKKLEIKYKEVDNLYILKTQDYGHYITRYKKSDDLDKICEFLLAFLDALKGAKDYLEEDKEVI